MRSTKLIALLLAVCMTLGLCSCGTADVPAAAPESSPAASDPAQSAPEATPEVPPQAAEPEVTEPEVTEPEPPKKDDVVSDGEEKAVPPAEAPEEPPAEPHAHKYTAEVVAPTCDRNGYTVHTCECGDSYKDSETEAAGHKYTDKTVAPTTGKKGYTLHTCDKCGHSYQDSYVDKLPAEAPKPACTSGEHSFVFIDGTAHWALWMGDHVAQYWCEKCGYAYLEVLQKTVVQKCTSGSHKWEDHVNEPTYETYGYTFSLCETCGYGYSHDYVSQLTRKKPEPNYVPASDLEGKKVSTTIVDAEDPNNRLIVTDPNTGEVTGTNYSFYAASMGTVVQHSELKKIGSPAENINHFFETMNLIDKKISRKGNQLYGLDGKAAEIQLKDNHYRVSVKYWGSAWSGGAPKECKTLVLNTLVYFGGESMGKAVWSMLEEHYNHRSDASVPITKELAAKYGLTIIEEGIFAMTTDGGISGVTDCKISDGKQTWFISYSTLRSSMATTDVRIPA